uniref:OSIGBa0135C13.8 protein n=1 Tax=Oryza sativa TaxID=4530 RepID=Q01KB1_ORYSA|nr:OSIGBa0135C13.8 [Oryza sativa]
MSSTSPSCTRLPCPLPPLSRSPALPRRPGFDFRIPPLSPLPLPHFGRRFPPLPATSGPLSPYLSSVATPSLFFPISPNSLVLPIAPAPCTHPPPPFPPLRPPLAAARLAATSRRCRRRVCVAKVHPVRPSSVEVRRRSAIPVVHRSSRTPSAACRPPSVAPRRRSSSPPPISVLPTLRCTSR